MNKIIIRKNLMYCKKIQGRCKMTVPCTRETERFVNWWLPGLMNEINKTKTLSDYI